MKRKCLHCSMVRQDMTMIYCPGCGFDFMIKKSKFAFLQNQRLRLAATGFLQVLFVALNTVFISNFFLVGLTATSFAISYIWSHNVKRVAFGDEGDRLSYAAGAALGCLAGALLGAVILK